MIDFPTATVVQKQMPKSAFYKNLSLPDALKEKFVSDVNKIVVENSLTKEKLNLSADAEIDEILLLSISLKKQDFDNKVIETIARQNPHKLVFVLTYGDKGRVAIYHRKLYLTNWMEADELVLDLNGLSLDEIWISFVEQIALENENPIHPDAGSLDDRLATQEEIQKLEKLIAKTEAAAWKEPQPKKKYEIYMRLQEYKAKLEELTNGKA